MSSFEQNKLWKNRISEQQASGLTITRWCKEHEISYRQFHYWKKRLSVAASHAKDTQTDLFVEIPLTKSTSGGNKQEERIHLSFHDAQIDIPQFFHPDTLLGLMKVLQQL